MKNLIAAILLYFLGTVVVQAPVVYDTQEECEQRSGKPCGFVMCDYIPKGKTFEEVCGKDFKEGWGPSGQRAESEAVPQEPEPLLQPVIGDIAQLQAAWPSDPVMIQKAEIRGDRLYLDVRYSGGCQEHTFMLGIHHMFYKSLPARVRVILAHDDQGDTCEAAVSRTVAFDLNALKNKYLSVFPGSPRTVILLIDTLEPTVTYQF